MSILSLTPRHLSPLAGSMYRIAGELVTVKAVTAETSKAYSLFEACTAPGSGTPPHLQRYEDEAVFVLEGMYAARFGPHTCDLGPGDYLFVPRETVHAFTNHGSTPSRMLMMVSPGDIYERFVAAVGCPVMHEATPTHCTMADAVALAAVGPTYGVELDLTPE